MSRGRTQGGAMVWLQPYFWIGSCQGNFWGFFKKSLKAYKNPPPSLSCSEACPLPFPTSCLEVYPLISPFLCLLPAAAAFPTLLVPEKLQSWSCTIPSGLCTQGCTLGPVTAAEAMERGGGGDYPFLCLLSEGLGREHIHLHCYRCLCPS